MELLRPLAPPHHDQTRESLSGFHLNRSLDSSPLPDIIEESVPAAAAGGGTSNGSSSTNSHGERVYVAVGKSVEKTLSLIHWAFNHFGTSQVCLLHVHQPSPLIPSLLGKLPASQANAEVVAAFRREEREQMRKLLEKYFAICRKAKVEASSIVTECEQVHKGIVELVSRHGVTKLVMWEASVKWMNVKKSSGKVNYAVKNAPLFCEIWFINKGKHTWTRQASERRPLPTLPSTSLNHDNINMPSNAELYGSGSARISNCSRSCDGLPFYSRSSSNPRSCSSGSPHASSEMRSSLGPDSKIEEESASCQLLQTQMEVEASRKKAQEEFLKCKKLESEALETITKVKLLESAYQDEVKLSYEAGQALRTTMQQQETLLDEREELTRELQRSMRNVAMLDNRAQESNRRHDEAAMELRLIQSSIALLWQEKKTIRRQKMEVVHWLERWRNGGQDGVAKCNGFLGAAEDLPELAVFSLADLQSATCNFSECFKLGQFGFGCVYKGEMLGRTVGIKKLHPQNAHGQSQFQKEVQVLGKFQHPHLATLLGSCPEAWCLVGEYMSNGNLQDRLFPKSNVAPLMWKVRTRIAAEISSALYFLHSSKPDRIIHGDLKPQNILLDSELRCKICEFGISRLVTDDTLDCPSFRSTEPKGALPYTDPEFHRIGVLTMKSDVYSFGVIILQLLTGRPPLGLVNEVRRTTSAGKLASILDASAGEWPTYVANRLADLGLQFCESNSRDRPELTPALVHELEHLHVSEERPVPSFFLCPILHEILHDPQVAADGFTYEGEALRGWFDSGHDTSPMTNLRLSHLHLTPNHALRLAIQDWFC